jgi:anti-sigma regulatory factor (Ser/Thr protein kinase)
MHPLTEARAIGEKTFARSARAPAEARGWIEERLAGVPSLDAVLLVGSELITNAVVHVDRGRWVTVQLAQGADFTRVTVTDPGGRLSLPYLIPIPESAYDLLDAPASGGRGLAIVDELSAHRWATYRTEGGRRVVWADIGCPDRLS